MYLRIHLICTLYVYIHILSVTYPLYPPESKRSLFMSHYYYYSLSLRLQLQAGRTKQKISKATKISPSLSLGRYVKCDNKHAFLNSNICTPYGYIFS